MSAAPESLDTQIADLQPRVRAAQEEIATAIEFHETWKPMALDKELHGRLGRSIASNTFMTIRTALRREMISALLRLWGKANDPRNLGLKAIATTLRRQEIVDRLADRREAYESVYDGEFQDMPSERRQAVIQALAESDRKEGQRQASMLRESISEVLELIGRYEAGGPRREVLERMLELRHHRLAHRQIETTAVEPENLKQIDSDIEPFYQDMLRIVSLLLLVVEDHNYDPETVTAARVAYNARVFWAGVRGERDEGHPFYKNMPTLPGQSGSSS